MQLYLLYIHYRDHKAKLWPFNFFNLLLNTNLCFSILFFPLICIFIFNSLSSFTYFIYFYFKNVILSWYIMKTVRNRSKRLLNEKKRVKKMLWKKRKKKLWEAFRMVLVLMILKRNKIIFTEQVWIYKPIDTISWKRRCKYNCIFIFIYIF